MTDQIKILSYNILDVELESNFVPRNMHKSCKDAILKSTTKNRTPVDWNNDFAEKYKPFHKGFGVMSKSETRKSWGSEEANGDNVNPNLRQILNNLFDESTATELYNQIKAINFPWVENRLQRVYNKIIKNEPDIVCLQEYGNCKDLSATPTETKIDNSATKGPFSSEQNINNDSVKQDNIVEGSLADKLTNIGYRYVLYSYNPDKSNGDDGIAIFYKGAVFEQSKNKIYVDMDKDIQAKYKEEVRDTEGKIIKKYTTQRGCGLLELTHRITKKKVVICTTHIQTTSNEVKSIEIPVDENNNENEKVTVQKTVPAYLIRSGELEYIKKNINDHYTNPEDLVIFCGDLNLDLNERRDKEVVDQFENENILKRIKSQENDDFGLVTSYPTGRKEYIDYFFTNCGGVLSADFKTKSDLNGETIPNGTDQPSDHIPILLTIPIILNNTVGGATRKNKKSKAKKTKKSKKFKKSKKSKKRRGF